MDFAFLVIAQNVTETIETMKVGWVDVVFMLFVVLGMFSGYRHGLAKETLKVISTVGALMVAFYFYDPMGIWIKRNAFLPQGLGMPVAFFVLLTFSTIFFYYALLLLGQLAEVRFAHVLDKIGGLLLGFGRYVVIFSLFSTILLLLNMSFISKSYSKNSMVGPFISTLAPNLYKQVNKVIKLPPIRMEPQIIVT